MKRLCSCGRLVERGAVCECQVAARRERVAKADAARPSASERGYDHEWAKLRKQMLAEYPTCDCGAPAVEVHHVISVRERPDLRLDPSNLQCLCRSCHSRITARTQAFGRDMRQTHG